MTSSAGNSELLGEERVVLGEIGDLVGRVACTDLSSVSREEMAEIVAEMAAESERLSAMAGRFMEIGERSACSFTKGERTMIGLVNAKGRLSRQRAASIRRAGRAVYRFPSFHTALLARKITLAHVDLMTKWAKKANTDQVTDAESALAAVAVLSTPEEFEDALRTWVAVADPNEHLDEFLRFQARRHLHLQPDLFSNVHVTGVLDPLLGEQVMNTIADNAQRLQADDRELSIAQANHDALVQLVLDPDREGTVHPRLEILVPDHDDDGTTPTRQRVVWDSADAVSRFLYGNPSEPVRVPVVRDRGFSAVFYPRTAGGNLIPPAIIETLRPDARTRYHRVRADGSLVSDLPAGRDFTIAQRRMIQLRDSCCQHSGCRRPARVCQYDHITPWSERGPTLISNGQLLCPFHHRWKHKDEPGHHTPVTTLFTNSPLTISRE
ncbi:MAG: HNH endonuclease [Acidimicrobiia bacterium]